MLEMRRIKRHQAQNTGIEAETPSYHHSQTAVMQARVRAPGADAVRNGGSPDSVRQKSPHRVRIWQMGEEPCVETEGDSSVLAELGRLSWEGFRLVASPITPKTILSPMEWLPS